MKDLIVGERDGYINYFERKSDGTLKAGVRLTDDNGEIKHGTNSSPELVDWNNDGLLDLLLASESNSLILYLNSGTSEQAKFTTYTEVKANGSSIYYGRPQVQVADMNYDGKFDLLLGNGLRADSRIYYYENSGNMGSPSFSVPTEVKYKDGTVVDPHFDVHFGVGDFNGDGGLDILYSDYDSPLQLLLGDPRETSLKSNNNVSKTNIGIIVKNDRITFATNNLISSEVDIFSINGKRISTNKVIRNESDGRSYIIPGSIGKGVFIMGFKTTTGYQTVKFSY